MQPLEHILSQTDFLLQATLGLELQPVDDAVLRLGSTLILTFQDASGMPQQSVLTVGEDGAVVVFSTGETPLEVESVRGQLVESVDWPTWLAQLRTAGIVPAFVSAS